VQDGNTNLHCSRHPWEEGKKPSGGEGGRKKGSKGLEREEGGWVGKKKSGAMRNRKTNEGETGILSRQKKPENKIFVCGAKKRWGRTRTKSKGEGFF